MPPRGHDMILQSFGDVVCPNMVLKVTFSPVRCDSLGTQFVVCTCTVFLIFCPLYRAFILF